NPWAVVLDRRDEEFRVVLERDPRRAAIAHGVLHHVADRAADLVRPAQAWGQTLDVDLHGQAHLDQIVAHALDQRGAIDATRFLAGAGTRGREDGFGHRLELVQVP